MQVKRSLSVDLKLAEMNLIVLYKEWTLLKEFETHDIELLHLINAKGQENTEIEVKVQNL